jgi:hypothetical protein
MCEAFHQRAVRIEVIIKETNAPYGTNTKNTNFPIQSTLDGILVFCTSAVIMGAEMGEMSKVG